MPSLNVLHISDTHFGQPKDRGAQKRITNALTRSVHKHIEKVKRIPQLCIFSGDIAHSATRSQYEKCENWLESLMKPLSGCGVFIIPGNHDVRRPKPKTKLMQDLRTAHYAEDVYNNHRDRLLKSPHLDNFVSWHKDLKNHAPFDVVSDWSTSRLLCHWKSVINEIPVNVLGINSAIMSCGNDDRGKLAADIDEINGSLASTNHEKELLIATSHHPVGVVKGEADQGPWFVNWNNDQLEKLLLQSTGPHLYLHGHVHKAQGSTVGMTSGQHLTLFGAGASYNTDRPMKFSFYDIDLSNRQVKPHTYFFREVSGIWSKDPETSQPVGAVLPNYDWKAVSKSYEHACKAAKAIFSQAFLEHDRPRHCLTEIHFKCRMYENGDGLVCNTLSLKPIGDEAVQFIKYEIDAVDPDVLPVEYVEELGLQVTDLTGKDVTYLVINNEPKFKELCIYFLPRIEADGIDHRKIEIQYRWPGLLNQFIQTGKVPLVWHSKASNQDEAADLLLQMKFPPHFSDVEFKNVGQISDDPEFSKSVDTDGTTSCTYRVQRANLRGGAHYCIEFSNLSWDS